MKYVIQESTLTGIGDAIRAKNGTSELIPVTGLADAITNLPTGGGGDIEVEPVVLTGDCSYACSGVLGAAFIENFGDKISTNNINSFNHMFYNTTVENIPFTLNGSLTTSYTNMDYMFSGAEKLKTMPEILNAKPSSMASCFENCENLREFPENFGENWDWSYLQKQTSGYSGNQGQICSSCLSLRKLPYGILKRGNPNINYSYSIYYQMANYNCCLDEIINLPFPHYNASWTSNAFSNSFYRNYRLKEMTFALQEDGSPYVMKWKNQTIDLSAAGWCQSSSSVYILGKNSGITADKEVKDDATYQALKNNPDWFSADINYSRYNHTSAVNTINSLPDCSATGTNTIKFKGASGALTDGGAINTLTEEEIAVATAKGWTVSLV